MKIRFSCVCDNSSKFSTRTRGWVSTLLHLGGIDPQDVLVHLVGPPDRALLHDLERVGVLVRIVERVSNDWPTLNKLAQLSSAELQAADAVVLCDCDIAFAGDLRPQISSETIRGRPVANPVPPLQVWEQILDAAGLEMPPTVSCAVADAYTIHQNLNGGVIMLPRRLLLGLATEWPRWTEWLEKKAGDTFVAWRQFSDQVSFALACIANRYPVEHVSAVYNYPAALKGQLIGDERPLILHYHDAVMPDGTIEPSGHPQVDAVIARVNRFMGSTALSEPYSPNV